jgi:hypothetical protein
MEAQMPDIIVVMIVLAPFAQPLVGLVDDGFGVKWFWCLKRVETVPFCANGPAAPKSVF